MAPKEYNSACSCDILQSPQVLTGISYESVESNLNREALDSQQVIMADVGLELQQRKGLTGKVKVIFPINQRGKQFYVKYNIAPEHVNQKQQQYFIAYCSKFYDYVDSETCSIQEVFRDTFSRIKDELIQKYLSNGLPSDQTIPERKSKTSVRSSPVLFGAQKDYYEFGQQIIRKRSLGHHAHVCTELFKFFESNNLTAQQEIESSIQQARKLYDADEFEASADTLESLLNKYFIH